MSYEDLPGRFVCRKFILTSIPPDRTSQPFARVKAERLYHYHKVYAESYATNPRNLEAPWKPVYASILEALVMRVMDKLGLSIDLSVQQEQPLAPPELAAAAVDADTTLTSRHRGTVYPDVFILRYLLNFTDNDSFHNVTYDKVGHDSIDYLVFAELKRSAKRSQIRQGVRPGNPIVAYLCTSIRRAALQASRQAFVAMKRPGETNGCIILIATVGPFWIWCLATRDDILAAFSAEGVDRILQLTHEARERDFVAEDLDFDEEEVEGVEPGHSCNALRVQITREDIFKSDDPLLHWSNVMVLDSDQSDMAFRTVLLKLLSLVKSK